MKKINLKEQFKKLTYSKGVDKFRMEITPYRDWRIIVILFFVGLIASFVFNLYISIEINKESYFNTELRTSGVVNFNEAELEKTVKGVDEKAARFEAAKTAEMPLVDPTL